MSKKRDYPSVQPFNVTPRRNKTKKNSWFYRTPAENNTQRKGQSN